MATLHPGDSPCAGPSPALIPFYNKPERADFIRQCAVGRKLIQAGESGRIMAASEIGRNAMTSIIEGAVTDPIAPDTALARQLSYCHDLINCCITYCASDRPPSLESQIDVMNVAARLMRTSVVLAGAIDKKPREFTHRVIVERRQAMTDITPPAGDPPPLIEKSKTIHGSSEAEDHNIE
jgi:hypothetical protein